MVINNDGTGSAYTRTGSNWGGGNICVRADDSWAIGSPAFKSSGLTNSGLVSFQEYYNPTNLMEFGGSFAGGQLGRSTSKKLVLALSHSRLGGGPCATLSDGYTIVWGAPLEPWTGPY